LTAEGPASSDLSQPLDSGLGDRIAEVAAATDSRRTEALAELDRLSARDWAQSAPRGADVAMSFADRWCLMRFGARPADVSAAAFVSDVFQRLNGS
jgi:hypothetical protein